MLKSGYALVDCMGIDMTSAESQTKTGLYKKLKAALDSGKPLIGDGLIWGSNNNTPLSPVHFFAQQWNAHLIVCTSSIYSINVTDEDAVTVVSLLS